MTPHETNLVNKALTEQKEAIDYDCFVWGIAQTISSFAQVGYMFVRERKERDNFAYLTFIKKK